MQVLCPMESLGWFTDETLGLTSLSYREVSPFSVCEKLLRLGSVHDQV